MKEVKAIQLLNWVTEYDIRPDSSLSEASCKQFLEDLLGSVRRGLERPRSSSSSSASRPVLPSVTSTPKRPEMERTQSMDDDAR